MLTEEVEMLDDETSKMCEGESSSSLVKGLRTVH